MTFCIFMDSCDDQLVESQNTKEDISECEMLKNKQDFAEGSSRRKVIFMDILDEQLVDTQTSEKRSVGCHHFDDHEPEKKRHCYKCNNSFRPGCKYITRFSAKSVEEGYRFCFNKLLNDFCEEGQKVLYIHKICEQWSSNWQVRIFFRLRRWATFVFGTIFLFFIVLDL